MQHAKIDRHLITITAAPLGTIEVGTVEINLIVMSTPPLRIVAEKDRE